MLFVKKFSNQSLFIGIVESDAHSYTHFIIQKVLLLLLQGCLDGLEVACKGHTWMLDKMQDK